MFNRQSTIGNRRPRGFTLVELLVVIGIIALLVGILFPTIRKMRIAGQEADSRNLLNQIDQACQAYYLAERAYPGPLPNSVLDATQQSTAMPIYDAATGGTVINNNTATLGTQATQSTFGTTGTRITAAENLVLGLCGGLNMDVNRAGATPVINRFWYDASSLGQGPMSLNLAKITRTSAYLSSPSNLTSGQVGTNDGGTPTGVDSIIPEFQDRFATPMPILYMRSTKQGTSATGAQNLVVNNSTVGDYNILQIQPYTNYATGGTANHGLKTANPARSIHKNNTNGGVTYQPPPYDAYDYLVEPSSYDPEKATLTPADIAGKRTRKKDSYVLISAGRDRIYGTDDDIVNFGSVLP